MDIGHRIIPGSIYSFLDGFKIQSDRSIRVDRHPRLLESSPEEGGGQDWRSRGSRNFSKKEHSWSVECPPPSPFKGVFDFPVTCGRFVKVRLVERRGEEDRGSAFSRHRLCRFTSFHRTLNSLCVTGREKLIGIITFRSAKSFRNLCTYTSLPPPAAVTGHTFIYIYRSFAVTK